MRMRLAEFSVPFPTERTTMADLDLKTVKCEVVDQHIALVRLDNPPVNAHSSQMILEIPAGHSRVRAHFARTRDRTLGGILGVASLFVALALFYAKER